jgi:hypothetical protein
MHHLSYQTIPQLLAHYPIQKPPIHTAAQVSQHLHFPPTLPANKTSRSQHTGQNARYLSKLRQNNDSIQGEPALDQLLGQDAPLR